MVWPGLAVLLLTLACNLLGRRLARRVRSTLIELTDRGTAPLRFASCRRATHSIEQRRGCRCSSASASRRSRRTRADSPPGVAAMVDGRVLESAQLVGKHLLLRFEGGVTLRSHLRMSGRWRVKPARHASGGAGPGSCCAAASGRRRSGNGPGGLTLEARPVARLGPDLLAARQVTLSSGGSRSRPGASRG